jgi:hypothetical protein
VLLRFETASDRHIQRSCLSLTQHFLSAFYPLAQDKLVEAHKRQKTRPNHIIRRLSEIAIQ